MNYEKLKIQLDIIKLFKENNYSGTVLLPTGVGKSYLGFLIIQEILNKNKNAKILIVVDRISLKLQWEEKYLKDVRNNVDVFVINSALKLTQTYNFVIYDEIDVYLEGSYFSKIFFQTPKYRLGLTATIKDEQRVKLKNFNIPIIYEMSLKDAVDLHLIGDKKIINIAIPLTDFESQKILELNKMIAIELNKLKPYYYLDLLMKKELRLNLIQELKMNNLDYTEHQIIGICRKIVKLVSNRDDILENNPKKIEAVKHIRNLHNESIITFSKWIEFCDELSKKFKDSKSFHSKLTDLFVDADYKTTNSHHSKLFTAKEQKDNLIDLFKEKKVRQLNTVNSVLRGLDITDLRIGIRTSGAESTTTFRQMLGRLRSDNSVLYCLYMVHQNRNKVTKEEEKLKKSQKEIGLNVIEIKYDDFIKSV